jgi:hypothetical protein
MEEEEIDLRVSSHPYDTPCRIVWRRLCVPHRREYDWRYCGVIGVSRRQTPGMASQYGSALRGKRNFLRILVFPGIARDKVKNNSVAFQRSVAATRRPYGDRYSSSRALLHCGGSRRQLWRLGLPQDKQRASAGPSTMITKNAKQYSCGGRERPSDS